SEDFNAAIEGFESLVEKSPGYHVGWLRLGVARRKLAQRFHSVNSFPDVSADRKRAALRLIDLAVSDLERAGEHTVASYRARAHYERSKALLHKHRMTNDACILSRSHRAAREAAEAFPDSTTDSWIDYLQRRWPENSTGSDGKGGSEP